jgi:hypothetical protein
MAGTQNGIRSKEVGEEEETEHCKAMRRKAWGRIGRSIELIMHPH